MASALDLVKKSMRLIGTLGQGETPTATESTDGLNALNAMLDSWSIERLMVYQILQETFTWTSGQSSRTIGSGGNFSTTRPTKLENGFTKISGIDYPYTVVDKDVYDSIIDKTTQSQFPEIISYQQASPLGTIYGWPVPSSSIAIYLNSWKQLQQFSALTTDLALPAGYQRAIEYNLAIELHGEYPEIQIPDSVVMIAKSSKAAIKSLNRPSMVAQLDYPGTGQRSNILADT
jgi:hypothetical protein